MNQKNIQNLIFDLGNVILNIDIALTINHFAKLLPERRAEFTTEIFHHELFLNFEKGFLSSDEFRHSLRQIWQTNWTDEQIDQAWNALILDFPPDRIRLLESLQKNYRLFLLSNTNEIHQIYFEKLLAQTTDYQSFSQLFEKAYYSHQMGTRKPEIAIYEQVLQENNLKTENTVLLDDNRDNIESARAMGMGAVHILPQTRTILEVFSSNMEGDFHLIANEYWG